MADDDVLAALEAVFAAVLAKARRDPAFARTLAKALSGALPAAAADDADDAGSAKNDAPALDPRALYAAEGADGLRRALGALSRPELYALVRDHDLAPSGASRLTKIQLIEHVAAVLGGRSRAKRRVFDY